MREAVGTQHPFVKGVHYIRMVDCSIRVYCLFYTTDMEYEDQEVEWNTNGGLESDTEYEMLESHEIIGSHDEAGGSPDDKSSFVVPDVSADIAKGRAARQQLGKDESGDETVYYPSILNVSQVPYSKFVF